MTDTRRRMQHNDEPINPDMGEGRHQDSLRRLRARIADGLELRMGDDDTIGNRSTSCTWGLCSIDPEQWPEHDDHIWPEDHRKRLRIAPRTADDQTCPHDQRATGQHFGCFYRCAMFQAKTPRTREETLAAIDELLEDRYAVFGRRTKDDDHEPWRNT